MSYRNSSAAAILDGRRNGVDAGYLAMGWVLNGDYSVAFNTLMNCDPYSAGGAGWLTWTGADQTSLGSAEGGAFVPAITNGQPRWVFVCWAIDPGVGVTFYWRAEGEVALHSRVVLDSSNTGGNYSICGSFNGGNVLQYLSAYKEWSSPSSLTPAQILAESRQKAPIVTSGLTNYLSCDVGSAVGTDQSGIGGNTDWTVNGTITTDALEPAMTALFYVQAAGGNLSNVGTGQQLFQYAQTAGNTNVVALWMTGNNPSSGVVTSVTDDAGNTYSLSGFINSVSGFGDTVWIYTCVGIRVYAAGNNVYVAWSNGQFVDVVIAEFPPTGAVRTSSTGAQYGGTPETPNTTLSGTSSGDLVVMAGWANALSVRVNDGMIGANTAYVVGVPIGDNFVLQGGFSDGSSPCALQCSSGTDDWWVLVALAFLPPDSPSGHGFALGVEDLFDPAIGSDF